MKEIVIDGQKYNLVPVEEKKEKDYKILSVRAEHFNNQIHLVKNGKVQIKSGGADLSGWASNIPEELIQDVKGIWKIHSLKYLPTGEIFTIGENYKCWDGVKEIEKIYLLNGDKLRFWMKGQIGVEGITIEKNASGYTPEHISNNKVEKKPVFTTEDGVDIFKGDPFYFVKIKKSHGSIDKLWVVSEPIKNMFEYEPDVDVYFSTKKAAEEYIELQKKRYSIADIQEALKRLFVIDEKSLLKNLKQNEEAV
jgi:hypothetical protein